MAIGTIRFCPNDRSFVQIIYARALTGTVLDPAGLPVQRVRVFLIQDSAKSKRQAWTGSGGEFLFSRLDPDSYALQTVQTGFS
jgi:hypothetical protein